jgi:hypothetical protein
MSSTLCHPPRLCPDFFDDARRTRGLRASGLDPIIGSNARCFHPTASATLDVLIFYAQSCVVGPFQAWSSLTPAFASPSSQQVCVPLVLPGPLARRRGCPALRARDAVEEEEEEAHEHEHEHEHEVCMRLPLVGWWAGWPAEEESQSSEIDRLRGSVLTIDGTGASRGARDWDRCELSFDRSCSSLQQRSWGWGWWMTTADVAQSR